MKPISISLVILAVTPMHLLAQDAMQSAESGGGYYSVRPVKFFGDANHITESAVKSNRKRTTSLETSLTEVVIPRVSKTPTTTSESSSMVSQASAEQVIEQAPQVIAQEVVKPSKRPAPLSAPNVAPQEFLPSVNVARPTPQNSAPTSQPEPIVESDTANNDFKVLLPEATVSESQPPVAEVPAEPEFVQREYQETFLKQTALPESAAPEAVSIDDLQMAQRSGDWKTGPTTMRDITDHFSPGGEPFANKGVVGNANFFGVDRRACCDEWAGHCNCSGGLKGNPGHLGIPWLRSKDNCDSAKSLFGHRKSRGPNGCGCSQCD